MIATDRWIESSHRNTKNGYIVSQNDEWSRDFSYWDQTSRETERWVGQQPDGSWIVGLFNRSDGPATRTIELQHRTRPQRTCGGAGLWARKDLGALSSYSADVPEHGCALVKLTPPAGAKRFDAERVGWSGHAIFNNVLPGFTGNG